MRSGVFALVAALIVSALFARGNFLTKAPISGFGAFYCAGKAVAAGRDPYRVEPLLSCERSLPSYRYSALGVVEPAPLPPFVLVGFAALAALPFGWALSVFLALSVAAVAAAVWALDRITGFGIPFVGASLLLAGLYQNLVLAEIPPLAIGALSVAAWMAQRGRFAAAAAAASLGLIEPHLVAPALAALFAAYRPARVPLAALALLAAGISAAALGPATTAEYFARVLPAHAASEVIANDQLSLTWVLHELGAGDRTALALGSASYAVMALLGVLVALRLAPRRAGPALVVLLPAAFAALGGTYVHGIQLSSALPAAIVLLGATGAPLRWPVLVALALLAAPLSGGRLLGAGVLMLGIQIWSRPFGTRRPARRAAWVAAACLVYGLAIAAVNRLPGETVPARAVAADVSGRPGDLASVVWARYVRVSAYGMSSPRNLAKKLPLWIGLVVVAGAASRAAFGTSREETPAQLGRVRDATAGW